MAAKHGRTWLAHASRVLLSACLVATVAAWSVASAQGEGTYGGTLRVALSEPAPSLDVHRAITVGVQQILVNVFETVAFKDNGGQNHPGLAYDWEISEDQLRYRFFLHEGVMFHDGTMMTAEDVKASLDRWFAVTPVTWEVASFDRIEIVDDYTVDLIFERALHRHARRAFPPPAAIMPKSVVDRIGTNELTGDDLVGTGPYRLVSFTPERAWTIERFDGYHDKFTGEMDYNLGKRHAYLDRIESTRVAEAGTRLAGLLAGDYDVADDLSPDDLDLLDARAGVNASIVPGAVGWYLKFNALEGPFTSETLRTAVRVSVRPLEIMEGFGDDRLWELNLFPRFYPTSPYNLNDTVRAEFYFPENVELGRALVAASGYDGEPIRVVGSRDLAGWYVQAIGILPMLQEIGLNAELVIVDRPTQLQMTRDTSTWEMKTSFSTPIRRAAVLGFHGRHRDGRQWPWADEEHLYYESVLWTDLNRRDEAITRMVQIELERSGQLWLGHSSALRGYSDRVGGMPNFDVLFLYNTWVD